MHGSVAAQLDVLGVRDLLESNIGHGADRYLPMIGSIGLFVLFSNLISLVPGLASPTAQTSVPLGCAIVVFIYYNWAGIAKHGPLDTGSIFTGAESGAFAADGGRSRVVSHLGAAALAHGSSLGQHDGERTAVRHFPGIDGGAVSFRPAMPRRWATRWLPCRCFPSFLCILHIFVAFVQAFVFTILPVIYLSGAVAARPLIQLIAA